MSGAPVVISDNGFGLPVRPVDANAPMLTVAENGLGAPIIISDRGVPFIIEGYNPDPPVSPFAPFSVEAGSGNGDIGFYHTIYGDVTAEPLPDFPLLEFANRNSGYTQVAFTGDCLALVQPWRPVIPGVTLTGVIAAWAFDGEYTSATWDSEGSMAVGQIYAIEWESNV